MKDLVFGILTFRYGWVKKESFVLWGHEYLLQVRVSSRITESPTKLQQDKYLEFKESVNDICAKTQKTVIEFIAANSDNIGIDSDEIREKKWQSLIVPKEVLFFQNGKYALLFETIWSESDMAILCDGNNYTVDESYILEYEL